MKVEQQQNVNIVDTLKKSIGPEEKENAISFLEKAETKRTEKKNAKSVNLKDATYLKPGAEEKKTVSQELEQSASMDTETRKNQMVVLANTTSAEDYARMQNDGFSLDTTTTNTIITETDKIKAQLAKAGVDISCFGDDLDMEQLEAIAGSPELARQLANAMKEADIPYTEENVKDVVETLQIVNSVQTPSEGAVKYLLDNELTPTIENLYKAEFSGSSSYQAAAEQVDISAFEKQVEAVVRQAGLSVNEETMADSKWLLENEIPLTSENLQYMEALKALSFPLEAEAVVESMMTAVAEGKRPQEAVVIPEYDLASQAQHALDVVTEATDEDLVYIIDNGMDLTVRSLEYAIYNRTTNVENGAQAGDVNASDAVTAENTEKTGNGETYTEKDLQLLTARRQLEEVRLAMTIEANYSLLKRGVTIDTEPLEQLVEQLKNEENAYYENLLRAQGINSSEENIALFRETEEKITELKAVPAYVLGMDEAEVHTVNAVHKAGTELRDTFERANERYETLMTAPRADLGDSIQKAFRNVDDILQDVGLELSEQNRRAVRILGYNELEITAENVARMKSVDEEVQRVFKNMTPAVVTQLIKKGVNPLDMDFADLNQTAEEIKREIGEEIGGENTEKFSEFLWKLEKNHAISEEERKSYIGIYRLIHQVEKTDGAVVGALLQQGAEITMRNLMMAVRSEHRSGKMDYSVDNQFGARENSGYQGTSVTEQIESSYQNNCLRDAVEDVTPERLRTLMAETPEWENMTPEQFKEALRKTEEEINLSYEYAREQLAGLETSAGASQDIYRILDKYEIPNTMLNVLAMEAMVKDRNQVYRQIFGRNEKTVDEKPDVDDLKKIKEELLEEFGEAVKSPKEMGEVQEKLGNLAENVMKTMIESDEVTRLDVREMRLLSAKLSISNRMAKDEQYSVPVLVGDEMVNVSLKIVRGVEKKGTVDIMMESELRGKIAATFQAKEEGVSGFVAVNNPDTKALLEGNEILLAKEAEAMNVHYAYMEDLDLNHFSMGAYGNAAETAEQTEEGDTYQVQTARLYQIAEGFIRTLRDVL